MHIETAMDDFLDDIDSYSMTEFDILTSLFEGGEFNGLTNGALCQTKEGNKFIVIGFMKNWINIDSFDKVKNLKLDEGTIEYRNKDQSLLGILYDEKHPEQNDVFLCKPDEVRLISSFDKSSHDYLLNKERLNMFMRAMEVSTLCTSDDINSLYKRSIGLKILYENISINGKQIVEMIDKSLKTKFIYCMLHVCSKANLIKTIPKYEWLDQSIYCTKTVATDEDKFFKTIHHQNSIVFENDEIKFSLKKSSKSKKYKTFFSK